MITLVDDRLALVFGAPLGAAIVMFALSRAPWLWLRLALALGAHAVGLATAIGLSARILQRGGFAFADINGWVGARVEGVDPFGLVPSALTPGGTGLLVAVELAGLLASWLLVPRAMKAGSSASFTGILVGTACCALLVVARRADGVCAAFALAGLSGFMVLVSFQPQRTDVEGAMRAFLLHRAGDVLLLVAVFVVGGALGGLDLEKLPLTISHIDPWARATSGPLTGFAAREAWLVVAALIALAAATRIALFPLLPLVRDATGAPGPAVGFAHGVCFVGAGLILLVRMTAALWLAPEVLTALGFVAATSVIFAGLVALAARDLLRIDVNLLCGFGALGAVAIAAADVGTGALAAALLIAAAVPLCTTSGVVVEGTGRGDPHALGGLETHIPRTHTARLLTTGALFGPFFTGAFIAAHAVGASLFAPWLGSGVAALLVVGYPLAAVAAFRPLHLVFTGKEPREPLSKPVTKPSAGQALPPLVVALPLLGVGLLHLPEGVLAALPFAVTYTSPATALLAPERGALRGARGWVLAATSAPHVHPTVVAALALGALALGWALSIVLYRGGPGRVHKALFGGPRVQRVVKTLAALAGRESQVAMGVGEQAARLSKLIATNFAPGVLDTLLRRIPSLVAGAVGLGVRFMANGSAQRGLLVTLAVLALLVVVLR